MNRHSNTDKRFAKKLRPPYKPTPYPIKAKRVTTTIDTEGGQKVKIYSQKNTTVKRYDYAFNPNLKEVIKINHSIIYQFLDSGDFAQFTFDPSGEQQPIWNKLEDHDIENLEAFSMAHHRQFHNPIPKRVRVRKKIQRKMRNIIDKFKE